MKTTDPDLLLAWQKHTNNADFSMEPSADFAAGWRAFMVALRHCANEYKRAARVKRAALEARAAYLQGKVHLPSDGFTVWLPKTALVEICVEDVVSYRLPVRVTRDRLSYFDDEGWTCYDLDDYIRDHKEEYADHEGVYDRTIEFFGELDACTRPDQPPLYIHPDCATHPENYSIS